MNAVRFWSVPSSHPRFQDVPPPPSTMFVVIVMPTHSMRVPIRWSFALLFVRFLLAPESVIASETRVCARTTPAAEAYLIADRSCERHWLGPVVLMQSAHGRTNQICRYRSQGTRCQRTRSLPRRW